MRDFFQLLKTKILRQPDRNFDQRFWAKFEQEFEPQREKRWIPRWAFASVAAAVVLLIGYGQYSVNQSEKLVETELVGEILAYEPMVENLELLEEFEVLPESDEDWSVLMGETDAG
jgi:hypothetical protein